MNLVTGSQVQFGRLIGLELTAKSVGVARAMIEDVIDRNFYGQSDLGNPTAKQVALAHKFGQDISAMSRRVGDAVIDDILTQLNHDAITDQRLATGVVVMNRHDRSRRRVISSITEDGTVYFRGGNGARAWARSLIRVDE